ncbi:MAG: MarR family transcriptional regulator [Methylovirgula sp.]|uniref:MarR family winged helix-turn-helix transcriptional regulator n=1 Tax=Methylovirgula sp. TaxID=1978224 RepID=UPI00307657F7
MSKKAQEDQGEDQHARAAILARELRIVFSNLKRRLREQATAGDLTLSQLAVLSRLDREGPATVSNLAREQGVRPQSMGATVAALEAAGLVRGTPDPADGRQTLLSLTEACRELIDASRIAREDRLLAVIEAKLTPAEQDELARGLKLLQRLVD